VFVFVFAGVFVVEEPIHAISVSIVVVEMFHGGRLKSVSGAGAVEERRAPGVPGEQPESTTHEEQGDPGAHGSTVATSRSPADRGRLGQQRNTSETPPKYQRTISETPTTPRRSP